MSIKKNAVVRLIKKIINWCDDHSGFVQAVLVLTLVLVTAAYALATGVYVKYARDTLLVAKQDFEVSNRPYLVTENISLVPYPNDNNTEIYLSIHNVGVIPAKLIEIMINDEVYNKLGAIYHRDEKRGLRFVSQKSFTYEDTIQITLKYVVPLKDITEKTYCIQSLYEYNEKGIRLLNSVLCE